MALNNPRDFDNSHVVTLDKSNMSRSNSKENHHFFPYSLRDSFGTDANGINSLLNFALISTRLNREISNDYPSKYLTRYAAKNPNIKNDLQTHFITEEAFDMAMSEKYDRFRELRGQEILNAIRQKVRVGDFAANSTNDEQEIIEENIEFETPFEEN
jgi:hypothetical protein